MIEIHVHSIEQVPSAYTWRMSSENNTTGCLKKVGTPIGGGNGVQAKLCARTEITEKTGYVAVVASLASRFSLAMMEEVHQMTQS